MRSPVTRGLGVVLNKCADGPIDLGAVNRIRHKDSDAAGSDIPLTPLDRRAVRLHCADSHSARREGQPAAEERGDECGGKAVVLQSVLPAVARRKHGPRRAAELSTFALELCEGVRVVAGAGTGEAEELRRVPARGASERESTVKDVQVNVVQSREAKRGDSGGGKPSVRRVGG